MVTFSTVLTRIEALRGTPKSEGDLRFIWKVSAHPMPDGTYAFHGFLSKETEIGFGRVATNGLAFLNKKDSDNSSFDEIAKMALDNEWIERMYDLGRRELESLAASMDFSFNFPHKAPDIEITEAKRKSKG